MVNPIRWRLVLVRALCLQFACAITILFPAAELTAQSDVNNTITLSCEQADGSFLNVQNIHTTIQPQESFLLRDGEWTGAEADWEGESFQVQTTYVGGWSIEVHYDDAAVERLGRWKKSDTSGSEYAVFEGRHVPRGLSLPVGFATRDETGCMLSRKFDPNRDARDYPDADWHPQDWDFVEQKMTAILNSKGIEKPWTQHGRRKLVGALANWIKDARLTGSSVEDTLHPVDFLDAEKCYCGGAAGSLVAMCSILEVPARYYGTNVHACVEFQDDEGRWLFVDNQPETFFTLSGGRKNPFDYETHQTQAQEWTREQNFDAVFEGGLIDLMADPQRFKLTEVPRLGWFYNWSCPLIYDGTGATKGADLCARPQVLHDWVFNLYTGYGGYEDDYIHKRGMFMGERLNSVYELAALYAPRRADLPYVCAKREGNDNIVFLTPFRDSYYFDWSNNSRVEAGKGSVGKSSVGKNSAGKNSAVRKRFYLSEAEGISKIVAAIILGPDGKVEHSIPADGGDWCYEVNGKKFPLKEFGGFELEENYQGTRMTVHKFELLLSELKFETER